MTFSVRPCSIIHGNLSAVFTVSENEEMGMRLDQPGEHRSTGCVDDGRVLRNRHRGGRAHRNDPTVFDQDGGVVQRRTAPPSINIPPTIASFPGFSTRWPRRSGDDSSATDSAADPTIALFDRMCILPLRGT